MRVVKFPLLSLRVSLTTLLAPSFINEINAPASGLPLLSTTAPETVARLPVLALAAGVCRQQLTINGNNENSNILLRDNLIDTKPPYVSVRETFEVIECGCGLHKIGKRLRIGHAFVKLQSSSASNREGK